MTAKEAASPAHSPSRARKRLMEQTLLRERFQNAIYDLIREYELAAGMSVVRVEYQPEQKRVAIDAIPPV